MTLISGAPLQVLDQPEKDAPLIASHTNPSHKPATRHSGGSQRALRAGGGLCQPTEGIDLTPRLAYETGMPSRRLPGWQRVCVLGAPDAASLRSPAPKVPTSQRGYATGSQVFRHTPRVSPAAQPPEESFGKTSLSASLPATRSRSRSIGCDSERGRRSSRDADHDSPPTELESVTAGELARATGLSRPYCSMIKRGAYIPHPKHWEAFRRLVLDEGVNAR